jgi:putative aldouronate transport system permease protein
MIGLVAAFKDYSPWRGLWGSAWVGLDHFKEFFSGPFAWRVIRNTFRISFATLIFGFPAPIILALLLNELRVKHFAKSVQTISYVPYFVSTVVVVGMVLNFLNPATGIVNTIIGFFGQEKINFLMVPRYFTPIYVIMEIWRHTGFNSIVFIAAIVGINPELYEAAKADGAGRWKQMIHITLPGILPAIVVVLLVRLGRILNIGFEQIILMYNPAIYESADVISTFVYRTGLMESRFDYATAVGLINSCVALILVVIANRISNKLTESGLW